MLEVSQNNQLHGGNQTFQLAMPLSTELHLPAICAIFIARVFHLQSNDPTYPPLGFGAFPAACQQQAYLCHGLFHRYFNLPVPRTGSGLPALQIHSISV
jgi:hypothetical protein